MGQPYCKVLKVWSCSRPQDTAGCNWLIGRAYLAPDSVIVRMISSRLKLAAFCRGG